MKHILLIGASGFVGSALLREALDRDIAVLAVARNPDSITVSSPNLKTVGADISSPDTVSRLAQGMDAVISAYNPGWTNPEIYALTLSVYPAIVQGVKRAGVTRLLIVGGAGTLFVKPGVRVMDSGAIPDAILPGVKALGEFYLNNLMKVNDLDWVFFSPAGSFVDGPRTGRYRLGKDDLLVDENGTSAISVADYAKAMLDEFETPRHHQERFTIGYWCGASAHRQRRGGAGRGFP